MRFIIAKNTIKQLLNHIIPVVPSKHVNLILLNILVKAKDDVLTLYATDLNITMLTETKSVNILNEGEYCFPAKEFINIINSLPEESIEIIVDEDMIVIKCLRSVFRLKSISSDLYPDVPVIDFENAVEINGSIFWKMINKLLPATSNNSLDEMLSAIYIKMDGTRIFAYGADVYKVGIYEYKLDNIINNDIKLVLSKQTLNVLLKILDNSSNDMLKIFRERNQVVFKYRGVTMYSVLLSYDFSDVERIRRDIDVKVTIDVKELLEKLQRVSILSDNYSHSVYFKLNYNMLELYSENQEIGGTARDFIEVYYDGAPCYAIHKANQIAPFLKMIDCSNVVLYLHPELGNIIEPEITIENEKYYYILMPMEEEKNHNEQGIEEEYNYENYSDVEE